MTHLVVEVEVGCLPKDLPEYIEVDMAALDVGESVHLSELVLPAGVRLMTLAHNPDNDQPVVSVQHPQKLEDRSTDRRRRTGRFWKKPVEAEPETSED